MALLTNQAYSSEKSLLYRRRRVLADLVEMVAQKGVRAAAAELKQPSKKFASDIQLARHSELTHLVFRVDAVDQHFLQAAVVVEALLNEVVDEVDGAHLPHQARVEAQRIDAIENGLRGLRY